LSVSNRFLNGFLQRHGILVLFGIAHVLIFTLFFKSGWIFGKFIQDDFGLAYFYSSRVLLGQIPYLDFSVEYPPLALAFMILPRLLTSRPEVYAQLFNIEMLVFDLIGLLLVAAIATRLNKSVWKTLAVYTVALAAIGPIVIVRFDMVPAILLLAALFFFIRGNSTLAWIFIALGTLTKLFPAVLIPLFIIYDFKRGNIGRPIKGAIAFLLVCALIAAPLLVFDSQGLLHSFTYHAERGLQCESTYASFLLIAEYFGIISLDTELGNGSVNVVSDLANTLANWSTLISAILLVVVYWLYSRYTEKKSGKNRAILQRHEIVRMITFSLLSVLVFVLTSKVFSPQFMIWFFPLIALLTTRWHNLPWMIFVMAALMTAFVYPKDYGGLENGELLAVGMLVLRNVTLIVLAVLVACGSNPDQILKKIK